MRKRIISLLLVMLCLSSLVLTSCSDKEDDTDLTTVRSATYLTLYGITEKELSEDTLKRVQDKLNTFTESSLKTSLVLRFYTKDKYQAALNEMFDLFKKEKDEAAALAEAEKEAKKARQAEEKKMTSDELRKRRQEERLARKEEERKAAQEERERLKRIEEGIEEPPEPITGAQMDVLYIDGYDMYLSLINEGHACSDNKSLLAPLDEYLKRDEKLITNYVNPLILNAAKVGGVTYGIPMNKAIGVGRYFVWNTALCEKYEIDPTSVRTLYTCEDILAKIKTEEPDVIPMVGPVTLNSVDFYGFEGSPIMVSNSEFGVIEAEDALATYKAYSVRTHFERMANFRAAGYFKDSYPASAKEFFLDIREGTIADAEKWREEGYTVTTYSLPRAKADEICSGLFGISSMSKIKDRSAEILTLIYTNPSFATALRYGVENEDYTIDSETGYVEIISDEYKMDFFKTGNMLIGSVEEKDKDYRTSAIAGNALLKTYAFNGYVPKLSEDDMKLLEKANDIVRGKYEMLCKGVSNWEEIFTETRDKLDELDFTTFMNDKFNPDYASTLAAAKAADASKNKVKEPYLNSEKEPQKPVEE